MARVEIKGVTKRFGPVEVIHGIDLAIEHGEFVVFVGPSGCGKSTLLRLICGLEPATSGEMFIGGRSMRGVPPARRGVAMVFQSYALYPHMTVAENMGFSLRIEGVSRVERNARVRRAAEVLQIEALLDRRPKELSGGQRQRVAIGRAIVRAPEVFLFDEPLSNLDAELRVQMRLELAKLHRNLGATMVFVTHDQTEAMTLADRIVVLRDGYIEQIGTPLEIYQAPHNRFVAGFIGSPKMNFLAATVTTRQSEAVQIAIPGITPDSITLPVRAGATLAVGAAVTLGVRPEHVMVGHHAALHTTAAVDFVEHLGGVSYLHAPGHPAGTLIIKHDGGAALGAAPGRVAVSFDPAQCHLFDSSGGALSPRR